MSVDLVNLLTRARAAKIGIEVVTPNPVALRQRLYAFRARAKAKGITSFDEVTFIISPSKKELWIMNKRGPNGDSETVAGFTPAGED